MSRNQKAEIKVNTKVGRKSTAQIQLFFLTLIKYKRPKSNKVAFVLLSNISYFIPSVNLYIDILFEIS